MIHSKQSGFTAVELLITLFVAVAFLVAGYQLYNVIVKDGGQTRGEARASNVAYDYLRRYTSSATNPCTTSTPVNNATINVAGISAVSVTVAITCPYSSKPSVSRIETTVLYNNPQATIRYATYSTGIGYGAAPVSPTGILGWWKFNGNASDSVNSVNGTVSGATLTSGQNGQANSAYSFNGSNQVISLASTFGLGITDVTISSWVYNPTATNSGAFVKVGGFNGGGNGAGYGIGVGSTAYDNSTPGTNIVMLFENIRWIPTSSVLGTGWHHVVMVIDSSGIPYAYRDGLVVPGSYSGAGAQAPVNNTTTIGGALAVAARYFNGSIDDVRIYGRALSALEISNLYAEGAQ